MGPPPFLVATTQEPCLAELEEGRQLRRRRIPVVGVDLRTYIPALVNLLVMSHSSERASA